jgi:hypothetical protein
VILPARLRLAAPAAGQEIARNPHPTRRTQVQTQATRGLPPIVRIAVTRTYSPASDSPPPSNGGRNPSSTSWIGRPSQHRRGRYRRATRRRSRIRATGDANRKLTCPDDVRATSRTVINPFRRDLHRAFTVTGPPRKLDFQRHRAACTGQHCHDADPEYPLRRRARHRKSGGGSR